MTQKNGIQVILTTSPAGLGHLRVMKALEQGLPKDTLLYRMGIEDPSLQWIHRITSRNTVLREMMEFVQFNPVAENIFTKRYRSYLHKQGQTLYGEFSRLIKVSKPKKLVVVSTHFGIAHELSAIKTTLSKRFDIPILLAVVVTDDSPQKIWAVRGADIIFVPSDTTRTLLLEELEKQSTKVPQIIVVPYPISPKLSKKLSESEWADRQSQVRRSSKSIMHVSLPISGAAVQLSYFQEVLKVLAMEQSRVHVISRVTAYSQEFLEYCQSFDNVSMITDAKDQNVVDLYEKLYLNEVISIEITKPSEQAFKTLYTPKQRGGAVILFSQPVGRQEYDNIRFLRRHRLLPSLEAQNILNTLMSHGKADDLRKVKEEAHYWRGLLLPREGWQAGLGIMHLKRHGILEAMMDFAGYMKGHEELSSRGVEVIWDTVEEYYSGTPND